MNTRCNICGYKAKMAQGLAGHRQFKHELAHRFPKPSELAQRVQTMEKREGELAASIELLEKKEVQLTSRKLQLEAELANLRSKCEADQSKINQLSQEFAKVESKGKDVLADILDFLAEGLERSGEFVLNSWELRQRATALRVRDAFEAAASRLWSGK